MFTVFLICAVLAGTVFLFQFVMLMVGFGLDGSDFNTDFHADVPGDASIDFHGDVPGDSAFDVHGDVGGVDTETGMVDHGSTMLAGVLSIRTVVAALTMFGLVGMAMLSAQEPSLMANIYATLAAIAGGAAAMFGVHFLMRTLYRLGADGKLHIRNAIGRTATVYVPIPANNEGSGKIQIRIQGRLAEFLAVTNGAQELKTGEVVRVTGVVAGSTVRVEPLDAKVADEAAAEVKA